MLRTRWLLRIRVCAIDRLLEFLLVFLFLEEVSHVEKGIAFESNIHKCRLHSRENSGDATLIDGTR